jgi:zinc protease
MQRGLSSFAYAVTVTIAMTMATTVNNAPARGDERQPRVPDLKVETYTLPNGLRVVLHEDHTTPVVGVNIWYRVGSMVEKPGRTGFAHLFEHLMFQGSQHHDDDYFGPLEQVGGDLNGSTSQDHTNYYETVPSNALELALWLESDRMGFLVPALSQQKLDNQRDVVKNERRQSYDNQPYGQAHEALLEALYPAGHPYHHSTIGSMADLSAARLDDVAAFFRTYYTPNNASLCIAGDFDPAEARRLVAKYFGPIPAGPEAARPSPNVPALAGPKHVTLRDDVELPRVELVWPTLPRGGADEPALDILAEILGGLDKENRLFRALMYDRRLAAEVSAEHPTTALSGEFTVTIYAHPDQDLDAIVQLADAEIERLKADGPTEAEVIKAQNTRESLNLVGLQAIEHRADYLNEYNVDFGDPTAYKDEMRRLFRVAPADVKRVAQRYLTANRVRLNVIPGERKPRPEQAEAGDDRRAQEPAGPKPPEIRDTFDRSAMPRVGPAPKFSPPPVVRRRLSNGLEVLIAERHELPILSLELVVKGGETLVAPGKEGLASLTAEMLTEGTKSRDALALAGALSEIGASIDASGRREWSLLSLTSLSNHQARALELFSDVLLNPSFDAKELERLRMQRLAAIQAQLDDPEAVAGIVFPRLIYGAEHPYGRPDLGTPRSVAGLTRDDLVAFYQRLYLPNNASLIVAGDTTPEAITAALEEALKGWKPGTPPAAQLPEPPKAQGVTVYLVDKPGAAQSILAVGQVGQPRGTPDYFPLTVMNEILGGQFMSRINLNLREDKGYSYGASSHFSFRTGPGPFRAGGAVQTEVTKEALVELLKELNDINGPRPIVDDELAFAKEQIIRGFPARFETTSDVAGTLAELVLYRLPDDYFAGYTAKVDAVTTADVNRVARKYLDPGHFTILVVGDRARVEPTLKTLPYARVINVLDPEGNPLPDAPPGRGAGPKE